MVTSVCQVQPVPSCEALRFLRFRLVARGTMASADSCSRPATIAGRQPYMVFLFVGSSALIPQWRDFLPIPDSLDDSAVASVYCLGHRAPRYERPDNRVHT